MKPKPVRRQKPIQSLEINGVRYEIAQRIEIIGKVLKVVGGKWKLLIIYHLTTNKFCRFGELQRKIPGITRRVLTLQLREMEKDGLVHRKIYAQIPPRVEYTITQEGYALRKVYRQMVYWGANHPKLLNKASRSEDK
jgi:DNA-binding HxlR family transcriptional regulator